MLYQTLAKLNAKALEIQKKIEELKKRKSDAKDQELKDIEASLIAYSSLLSKNESRQQFCLDEISQYQPKLEDGKITALNHESMAQKLKAKATSKIKG